MHELPTAERLVFTAPHRGGKTAADLQGRQLQEGPEKVRPSHRRPQEAAGESLRRCGEGTESAVPADFKPVTADQTRPRI